MKRVLLYIVIITLSLPSLGGGLLMTAGQADDRVEKVDSKSVTTASPAHHAMSHKTTTVTLTDEAHNCCLSENAIDHLNGCCDEECHSCMNECSNTSVFAMITTINALSPIKHVLLLSEIHKLPASPVGNTLIPPLA